MIIVEEMIGNVSSWSHIHIIYQWCKIFVPSLEIFWRVKDYFLILCDRPIDLPEKS